MLYLCTSQDGQALPLLTLLMSVSLQGNLWVQVACMSPQVPQKGRSRAPKLSKIDAQDLQNGTQKSNFPCVAQGVGGMGVSH